MTQKKLRSSIQLSFDEYADVWQNLVNEFYCRSLSDGKLSDMLLSSGDMNARFSIELSTVILVIAMLKWNEKQIHSKVKNSVMETVVMSFYKNLIPDAQDDNIKECIDFFNLKYGMFSEIFNRIDSKNKQKNKTMIVGLARYLVAQVSPDEKSNFEVIESLSILLFEAEAAFAKLAKNTFQDSIGLPGKPKFIIQHT